MSNNIFLTVYNNTINYILKQLEIKTLQSSFDGELNYRELINILKGLTNEINKIQLENDELKSELRKYTCE